VPKVIEGPNERVRLAYVAQRFYRDEVSQSDIANEIGVSRFKIARMLARARELEIIKFEITAGNNIDTDLSMTLQAQLGMHRVVVVAAPTETDAVIRGTVGRAAADLLSETVQPGDTIGLTSGRTVSATIHALDRLPRCDVVALCGASGDTPQNGFEVLREVQRLSGGRIFPIFAPLLVREPSTARALLRDPVISDTIRSFRRVSVGVFPIGSWTPPMSQLFDAAQRFGMAQPLLDAAVVGDVGTTLFRADGSEVTSLADHLIAIDSDTLRAIPERIGVAGGVEKSAAIRAAIRAGMFTSLVIDVTAARDLISTEPPEPVE
jgi:DNA-binding transcriptional regulator LsrR (DeoR family)